MKPRHRAQLRLARPVPGVRESIARQPSVRLVGREEDTRPVRPLPGGTVKVPEQVKVKPLRTARFGPYAPLLIRLVRSPYALRVGRSVRRIEELRQRLSTLDREPFPNAVKESEALRLTYRVARPMQAHAHTPDPRPRPFERARREAEVVVVRFDWCAEEDWL